MPTTVITRIYETRDQAQAVVAALKPHRFSAEDMDIVGGDLSQPMDADAAKRKLEYTGVLASQIGGLADHAAAGKAVLVIRAGFGRASTAMSVADAHDPIEPGVKHTELFDAGTSVSQLSRRKPGPVLLARGTTVLSGKDVGSYGRRNPTPFSSLFKIPVLKRSGGNAKLLQEKRFTDGLMPMLKHGRFTN